MPKRILLALALALATALGAGMALAGGGATMAEGQPWRRRKPQAGTAIRRS